jgi:hypothetical protein
MISYLVRNFVVFALVVLSGCVFVASRKENPVIEDRIGLWGDEPLGTLATTAERRIALVRLNDGGEFYRQRLR